jgi:hypothetical protein
MRRCRTVKELCDRAEARIERYLGKCPNLLFCRGTASHRQTPANGRIHGIDDEGGHKSLGFHRASDDQRAMRPQHRPGRQGPQSSIKPALPLSTGAI